jgi:hypothetical protein
MIPFLMSALFVTVINASNVLKRPLLALNPMALDVSTFTCKPCCTRSIHGRVSTVSCCNCPLEFNGFCSNNNQTTGDFSTSGDNFQNDLKTHSKSFFFIYNSVFFTKFFIYFAEKLFCEKKTVRFRFV